MITLLIVLASVLYGACLIAVSCRIATAIAWRMAGASHKRYPSLYKKGKEPDGFQWTGAACLGLIAATLWPAVGVLYVFRGQLFKPPAQIVNERQAKRIKELERELEIA